MTAVPRSSPPRILRRGRAKPVSKHSQQADSKHVHFCPEDCLEKVQLIPDTESLRFAAITAFAATPPVYSDDDQILVAPSLPLAH